MKINFHFVSNNTKYTTDLVVYHGFFFCLTKITCPVLLHGQLKKPIFLFYKTYRMQERKNSTGWKEKVDISAYTCQVSWIVASTVLTQEREKWERIKEKKM